MKKITQHFILLILLALSISVSAQDFPPSNSRPVKTWTGAISASYSDTGNWDPIGIPVGTDNLIITTGTKHALSMDDVPDFLQCTSLTLEPGVQFNVETMSVGDGGYMWLQSKPTNNLYSNLTTSEPEYRRSDFYGTVKVEAGCSVKANKIKAFSNTSIILESTSTTYASVMISDLELNPGAEKFVKIVYKLYTNKIGTTGVKGGNDLISAPLLGKFDAAFVGANPELPHNSTNNLGEYAFAPYNVTVGAYQNFDINPSNGSTNTESIPFVAGKGYRAATVDGSTLTFSGFPNIQPVAIEIFNGPEDKGNGWNLIGNPYPTYLKFNDFLTSNIKKFDINYQAIYGYNSSEGWTIWNLSNTSTTELITPGQGFFVKAKAGASSVVNFTRAMRTTGTSDDFIVGRPANENKALSKLKLSSATNNSLTSVYFIEGSTRGIDPGYDAGVFSGSAVDFSLFTNLLESNTEIDLAIQSLPYNDFNNVIVPLGIKAKAGAELSISIDDLSTLPSNINVYLEDTQNKTLNLLNDGAYTFKPTTDLNGADRFNVHYSSKTLSVEDMQSTDNLHIYTTASPKTLYVKGQLSKATTANLYDIQGRLVLRKVLNPTTTENTMDISTISTGIYIVKVKNDNQIKTQKVIIK